MLGEPLGRRPSTASADAEDRGLRASPSSPARSSCAIPVVERRSSHRRDHVDHTELLTVASTCMGDRGGLTGRWGGVQPTRRTSPRRRAGWSDGATTAAGRPRSTTTHSCRLVLAAEHTTTHRAGHQHRGGVRAQSDDRRQRRLGSAGVLETAGSSLVSAHRSSRTSRSASACRGAGPCRACASSCWRSARSGRVGRTARSSASRATSTPTS